MKLRCPCGNLVFDSTDYQSHKAAFVAEQDEDEFLVLCAEGERGVHDAMRRYSRSLYQCDRCARLLLLTPESLLTFAPEREGTPANLLRSVEGENWKRNLRARWCDGKGEVWWGFGVEDEAFLDAFASADEVERLYRETFERLRGHDRLRSSFLDIDGARVHTWPER